VLVLFGERTDDLTFGQEDEQALHGIAREEVADCKSIEARAELLALFRSHFTPEELDRLPELLEAVNAADWGGLISTLYFGRFRRSCVAQEEMAPQELMH
jgi:hypothetical protein